MKSYFASFMGFSAGAGLLIMAVLLLIFIFEIVMFVDVIRNRHIVDQRKLLWVIGMILVHPFVAIAYYFTDHQAAD